MYFRAILPVVLHLTQGPRIAIIVVPFFIHSGYRIVPYPTDVIVYHHIVGLQKPYLIDLTVRQKSAPFPLDESGAKGMLGNR